MSDLRTKIAAALKTVDELELTDEEAHAAAAAALTLISGARTSIVITPGRDEDDWDF